MWSLSSTPSYYFVVCTGTTLSSFDGGDGRLLCIVRLRIGVELVVAGCKALFSALEFHDSGYTGRDSSGAPPNTLQKRQQSTS